jgi:enamidase
MRTAIVDAGTIVSGDWRAPFVNAAAIVIDHGRIESVGEGSAAALGQCDVVIDAAGAAIIPGLIDSQVHNTFGDFSAARH